MQKTLMLMLAAAAVAATSNANAQEKTRGEYEKPKPVFTKLAPAGEAWDPVATFSILGYDPETGEVGGAVQSRVFSVGNGVLWAEAGVGAVATQAVVDVSYGPQALRLLKLGYAPDRIVKLIHDSDADPNPSGW